MARYINTTTQDTELIPKIPNKGNISSVSICNTHASDEAEVDLFIDDGSNQYYYVYKVKIPVGATLVVNENVAFDSSVYDLNIKNSSTNKSLSIIIK